MSAEREKLAYLLREQVARETGRTMSTRESDRVAERVLRDGGKRPNHEVAAETRRDRDGE